MKKICLNPLFIVGLLIRLWLIVSIMPLAVTEFYLPFLDFTLTHPTIDPWTDWLENGGVFEAFPYGYAMWIIFLPLMFFVKLAGLPLQYGYNLTLLAVDIAFLFILHLQLPERQKLLLVTYWLSPIVLLATYVLGLNDLIPVLFLTLSILFIRQKNFYLTGIFLMVAISAKLSMVLALPFYIIYLYNNKPLRQRISEFFVGCFTAAVILATPFIFSSGGLQMLFENQEMDKIYHLALDVPGNLTIYFAPLIFFFILYTVWWVKRLNFDLFLAVTGLAFLFIVFVTPSSPGWFVWSIPFLVFYQAMSGRVAIIMTGLYSGLYVINTLLVTPTYISDGYYFNLATTLPLINPFSNSDSTSLLYTFMLAIGGILMIRMWQEAISKNDFYRLSRKPFVIGIAGDSGSGKDTLSDAITGIFGNHSVVKLSGDDYHLWDRQKPMWKMMTHLNPMANDLERFSDHLISLIDGKTIQSRHYDHQTGKMSKPLLVNSNDFIIANGLHALYLPILRECYSLKIYLDIDEGLRRYFKFRRDVKKRGHTVDRVSTSLEKREPDAERFIRPQSAHADLIFSLKPMDPQMLEKLDDNYPLRMKLTIKTRHGFNELSLNRVLVGVCGLHVDIIVSDDGSKVQMTIEGDTSAADIALAAEMLCPNILEFLDIQPKWQDGITGLMQVITLSHISQSLAKRFI